MKIPANVIETWKADIAEWLEYHHGLPLTAVKTGTDAWAIAHRVGITREAYNDPTVTDGHIQTALVRIFPNAVFKDCKVY